MVDRLGICNEPNPIDLDRVRKILASLSTEQLQALIKADKWKRLTDNESEAAALFRHHPEKLQELAWLADALTNHIHIKSFRFSGAIAAMFSEAPSYPALMLWCLVSTASLAALPLVGFSVLLITLSLTIPIVVMMATKQALTQDKEKQLRNIQFNALQITCVNYLLAKDGQPIENKPISIQPPKDSLMMISNATIVGSIVSATWFGTFYMAFQALIDAIQLVELLTVLTSPISLAVILGVSLLVGVGCAYSNYQYAHQNHDIKKLNKQLQTELTKKRGQYEKLESKNERLAAVEQSRINQVSNQTWAPRDTQERVPRQHHTSRHNKRRR